MEIEGKSNRIVHFYLWAIYEGVEYDLRHEIKAYKKNGICETEMKLFYVEPFYIDFYDNNKKDAKVEYFAKIKMQGAKEIRSELMVMPRPPAVQNISRSDNFRSNVYGFPEIITGEIELLEAQKISLKVTEEYEGGQGAKTLIGNFDGQGISWGIMQWNFGQGTLGHLLNKMMIKNHTIFRNVFGNNKKDFEIFIKVITEYDISKQIEWAKTIQNDNFQIIAKWKEYFDSLANIELFIELQEKEAIKDNHNKTLSKLNWLRQKHPKLMEKITLRTYASLFDLSNQQGGIDSKTIKLLEDQWFKNPPLTQFEIIKNVVYNRGLSASGSGGKYRADCISRRMGILYASPYKVNKNINKGIICDSLRTNSFFNLLKMNKIVKGI